MASKTKAERQRASASYLESPACEWNGCIHHMGENGGIFEGKSYCWRHIHDAAAGESICWHEENDAISFNSSGQVIKLKCKECGEEYYPQRGN